MKNILIVFSLLLVFACTEKGESIENQSPKSVQKYSDKNITPQVDYDTTENPAIDTISSAKGAKKQAN